MADMETLRKKVDQMSTEQKERVLRFFDHQVTMANDIAEKTDNELASLLVSLVWEKMSLDTIESVLVSEAIDRLQRKDEHSSE